MKRKDAPSAREQFAAAPEANEARRDAARLRLRDAMSENLERIAVFLPGMMSEEASLRGRGRSLTDGGRDLAENYFGGFELERLNFMRLGVNVFEIGLSYYNRTDAEAMPGFKALVKACASPDVDMDVCITANPGQASQMVLISMDKPFNHEGPYKGLVAAPAPKTAAAKPKTR